ELLAPNGGAVVLGQPAPDAVLDVAIQGLASAVGLDRAAVADLEGTGNVEWGLRGEEQVGVRVSSAGGGHAPVGEHHAATPICSRSCGSAVRVVGSWSTGASRARRSRSSLAVA